MKSKQYAVLGLGVFGSTVATTLAEYGHEVLAVDKDISCVERISDEVTKAIVADITNPDELEELGLEEFDVVIVAIGTHLEEAVLATMFVKERGVPYVIAKAKNKQFAQILQKVGADRVVRVEKDMGVRIAKSVMRNNIVDVMDLDEENAVVEIKAPIPWIGKTIQQLNIRTKFDMNILGMRDKETGKIIMGVAPEYSIVEEDRFLVLARTDKLEKFDTI